MTKEDFKVCGFMIILCYFLMCTIAWIMNLGNFYYGEPATLVEFLSYPFEYLW